MVSVPLVSGTINTYIYPVAPPGYWGTMNRGVNNVEKDWMRIRK